MKREHRERSWSTIIHDFIYVVEMYRKPTHRHLTVSFTGLDVYTHKKVRGKTKVLLSLRNKDIFILNSMRMNRGRPG